MAPPFDPRSLRGSQKPRRQPVGWPLLPVPRDGALAYPSLEESVRDAIKVILMTRAGEQRMRPTFGAGLDRFLHEPNTLTTRRRIQDTVRQALATWESRIEVDRVDVSEVEGRPSHVRVDIAYRIRRIGAPQQLGVILQMGS